MNTGRQQRVKNSFFKSSQLRRFIIQLQDKKTQKRSTHRENPHDFYRSLSLQVGEGENVDHFPIHVYRKCPPSARVPRCCWDLPMQQRKNWLVKAVISKWTKTKNTFNQFGWLNKEKKLVSTVNMDLRYFCTSINPHTEIEQTYQIQHILPDLVYSNSRSFLRKIAQGLCFGITLKLLKELHDFQQIP